MTQANSAITLQTEYADHADQRERSRQRYQVATQVTNLTTQLQTAYSLTAQIHKLSLVNFL